MNEAKKAEVEDRSIILRLLRVTDIWSIHRMYDALSLESKRFFHPRIFGLKSISWYWIWYWVLAQVALTLSCNTFMRYFLRRVYAKASFFMVVAVEANSHINRIIGLAYLRGDSSPGDFSMSICVHDSYQGMGIGSDLMEELIKYAQREGARRITLSVIRNNVKAISLYRKYGFKPTSNSMMPLDLMMTLELHQKEEKIVEEKYQGWNR